MNAKGAKKAPKKKANGYQMPEPIKSGEILTDMKKKQWIIGSSIGVGGFGEIYAAAPYTGKIPKEYPAVIKIEPHGNGPLFVEMHFYMRNANPEEIEAWRKKKKLTYLGMPKFLGSGSHDYNNTKYRFLVVERYGTDLWKLFIENGRKFPEHTVYRIAIQVIDALEYIHQRKYIHGDIKGGNLLLDLSSQNNVCLVDFGLACHYTVKADFTPDPKKAHDGTMEYTSRDAHKGVATMRGDLEILGYNLIQWLCGLLPWEKNLKEPVTVQKQKEQAFQNVSKFLNQCFDNAVPAPINQFMTLLESLKFNETPNYEKFKQIFVKGLQQLGHTPNGRLEFKVISPKNEQSPPKRSKISSTQINKKILEVKQNKAAGGRKSLNESFNMVLDKKFVSGNDAKDHLMANVDFDSEAEYDIQIKKRRKKTNTEDASLEKTNNSRKRKEKKEVIKDSESELDSETSEKKPLKTASKSKAKTVPKVATRIRISRKAKIQPKYANSSSEEDMFNDD